MRNLIKSIRAIYFTERFFYMGSLVVLIFIFGHFFPFIYLIAKAMLVLFLAAFALNIALLFSKKAPIRAERKMAERLSNGDDNKVTLYIRNSYNFEAGLKIIDEIPFQFQIRNFEIKISLKPSGEKFESYILRPVERGEYNFGLLNIYVNHPIGLINRRIKCDFNQIVPVYPSYIQLRKFELLAISNRLTEAGIKKIRRVSHTLEFDQIREYVKGDDFRTINWKATARKSDLMVNQYQDEKSQQVYCLIDMGRTMEMPFNGLSLLDYAVNSSLVISNIAMYKQDKAGLLTFSKNIHTILPADRNKIQMHRILEALYRQKTNFDESDFENVYTTIKRKIKQRSLLLLFTNFEWEVSLSRQMRFLRQLNNNHLLIVIFFKNTEVNSLIREKSGSVNDVYVKTIAEKLMFEKKLIVKELKKYGIQSILTEPENLTVNTINKYLELKAMGKI
ncbi:MAG: DUF58 domain-containing protein [Bacteroidales bacterium]|nr:DUF58 domain-containing protein [Bacteroidales bacterium]